MPGMSGMEVLKKIIAEDDKTTVIMVSAIEQERIIMEAILSGARKILIEPFHEDKIQEVLARL